LDFEHCLQWAQKNDVHYIECGTIDGVSWLHGLGYQPHVALWEDPVALRKKMDSYGVQFSQLDALIPLSLPNAESLGTRYIINSIRWASLAGCTHIDTTDHMHKPAGLDR
jgi:inosose dehydratase